LLGGLPVFAEQGDTDADLNRDAGGAREGLHREQLADAVDDDLCSGTVGIAKDDHELVPAETGDAVTSSNDAAQGPGNGLDRGGTDLVSPQVVELLEVVDVDEE
jgi:hypothetical protein